MNKKYPKIVLHELYEYELFKAVLKEEIFFEKFIIAYKVVAEIAMSDAMYGIEFYDSLMSKNVLQSTYNMLINDLYIKDIFSKIKMN